MKHIKQKLICVDIAMCALLSQKHYSVRDVPIDSVSTMLYIHQL
jgi:hypothetical protein